MLDATKPTAPPKEDFFADLDKLRVSQNFAASVGVKKVLLTVPVRKPSNQAFVRTHPDEAYRLETAVLELKDERETYIVVPELWQDISTELVPKVLFTAIDRQNNVFLWPIRLPGNDGRLDQWNQSALEAAQMARSNWVRISANMSLGA
ncbi:MAG: hypothetical protein JSV78_15065, partial [Phycisphaerales bacterium]